MVIILERKLRNIVEEEIGNLFAERGKGEIKNILISIRDEISAGFKELDLDLDLIYGVLAGGEDVLSTQIKQSMRGRGMIPRIQNKKGGIDT